MSHRILREEAIRKYEREMKNRELIKQGIKIESKRKERKKKYRDTKISLFIDKLRSRGGYALDKKKEKEKNVENSN